MTTYTYNAIFPKQSSSITVFSFCAPASEIQSFSIIDRISRHHDGALTGFQRPQVASHIEEIKRYLRKADAVLPNSIVIAFTSGISIQNDRSGKPNAVTISADPSNLGFVVDGQQRLTALSGLPEKDFEVLVSGILCSDEQELRKQFILINNSKPLPKTLIYELLPSVTGLPHRLSSRSDAASLIERLNYDEHSSLRGQINQHTNPSGVVKDTVMQKVIMNSLSHGALREIAISDKHGDQQFELLSYFYGTVQEVYPDAWLGHTPRTSRLVHSVGIVSMGYVMEHLYSIDKLKDKARLDLALNHLKDYCAWTEGFWEFGADNKRIWNSLQFVPRDYLELTNHLIRQLKSL